MSTPQAQQSLVRIIVNGAGGRMGARVCALALEDGALSLVGALARTGSSRIGQACAPSAPAAAPKITDSTGISGVSGADVVIDFSSDAGAIAALDVAVRTRAALLVGTTALAPATIERLRNASRSIAVLVAPNTSLGVTALAAVVQDMARTLGPGYQCSIVEAHHIAKKDAPSGTALRLADAARRGGASLPEDQVVSIRGGDVIGEHTIRFAGPGEYLELTHRATTRDLFARGALSASKWLAGKPAGWWNMNDVLGLPAR
jgi:4-hydroxy-tetrahydrodipicolinate reductase